MVSIFTNQEEEVIRDLEELSNKFTNEKFVNYELKIRRDRVLPNNDYERYLFNKVTEKVYTYSLENNEYIYFCDLGESDENGSTIITDHEYNILSDNIHATNAMLRDIEDWNYTFISEETEYNAKEYLKNI